MCPFNITLPLDCSHWLILQINSQKYLQEAKYILRAISICRMLLSRCHIVIGNMDLINCLQISIYLEYVGNFSLLDLLANYKLLQGQGMQYNPMDFICREPFFPLLCQVICILLLSLCSRDMVYRFVLLQSSLFQIQGKGKQVNKYHLPSVSYRRDCVSDY